MRFHRLFVFRLGFPLGMDEFFQARLGGPEFRRIELARRTRARYWHLDHFLHFAGVRLEHQDAIGQIDRLVEIVRDEQHRDVDVLPDVDQMRLHLGTGLGIERAEGLVHEQDARLVDQRTSDGDALAHAAGQLMRIGVGKLGQTDQIQPQQGIALGLILGATVHLGAEHHVFLHGQPGKQGIALEHHAAILPRTGDRFAVQQHVAGRMAFEAGEDADQCRLAAAGGADHADEFAPADAEVDAAQGLDLALERTVAFAEIAHLKDGFALVDPVEARLHGFRLVQVAGQIVRIHGGIPQRRSWVRSQGNRRRPSRARIRSVPKPMMPMVMMAA